MRFKKVFSNLELEGQGRGIIMGVTGLQTAKISCTYVLEEKLCRTEQRDNTI